MKKLWPVIILFCFACNTPAKQPIVYINFLNDHRSILMTGVDSIVLKDIDRDSVKNWQSLFAIYRLPADEGAKDYQPIQPGKYQLKAGSVMFTPDTPFVKSQEYFVRYYNYADNKSIWDYIRHKTTKGQLHYTDLIFKP